MKLNSLIGLAIAGGGAYLLLRYLGYFGGTTATTTTTTTASAGTPVATGSGTATTPQAANPQNTSAATTKQMVINALVADKQDPNAYQSVDYWNFYYNLVRGIPGPSPSDLIPNITPGYKLSIDDWWNAMVGHGFSGMGLAGLGCPTLCNTAWGGLSSIARSVNPYANPLGQVYGNYLRPSGFERAVKFIN